MYNLKYISSNGKEINFNPFDGWFITKVDGLTDVEINLIETQGIIQIGSTIQGRSVQAKNITIEGTISGISTNKRKEIIDTITPLTKGKLIFNNLIQIDVEPVITPYVEQKHNAFFQFVLRAPYPYWYSIDEDSVEMGGFEPAFKFPINYGQTEEIDPKTHIFGRRKKELFTNIYNSGNVPSSFKVIFIAQTDLSSPSITKVKTLEFIKIRKNMQAGDMISVDTTGNQIKVTTIRDGIETNDINSLDIDSSVFLLDVGDNLLQYDAENNRDGLICRINKRNEWSGAYGDDKTYF